MSEAELSVLEDARKVAPVIAARAADADRHMRFPREDLDDLRGAGLMALAVPERYGGRGVTTVAYVNACEVIAAADASLAIAWVMHTACGWEIAQSASPHTRVKVLQDVIDDGAFVCIAGAEGRLPDGTPAPLGVHREGSRWILDGRKGFASGSEAATYAVTGGATETGKRHSFIVRMDNPGLSIADCWDGMGMRASASHGLAFEHCVVPESHRLTADYKFGDFRNTSALFGLGLAATALGIAQAALDFTLSWSRGRSISEANRVRLGDISVTVEAVRSLVWRAAWEADRDAAASEPWVDRAKTFAVESGQKVTVDALRVCGGNAFRQKYALERHARDADALLLQGQRPDQLRIGIADAILAAPSPQEPGA